MTECLLCEGKMLGGRRTERETETERDRERERERERISSMLHT